MTDEDVQRLAEEMGNDVIKLIHQYLKENLSLDIKTTSEYTGGYDGPLYKDVSTIQLILDGDVISEVTI